MTDTHEAVRLAGLLSADPTQSPVSLAAAALLRRIPELEAEVDEQAKLNGMGAERELALTAKAKKLRANAARWEWIADGNNFDESFALLTDPALTSDLLTRAVDAAIANARKDTP